ncbi:MAG: DNA gyrase inhibitor YacG [Phyllobacteriaceae bacterium]|nr:DNA gyrase inhibitor YacG [Phyllobacteriaceae bacterium]
MAEPILLKPKRPCPICNKPSTQKFHPFCSNRCAQVDLSRWLGGRYAIPAVENDGSSTEETDNEE